MDVLHCQISDPRGAERCESGGEWSRGDKENETEKEMMQIFPIMEQREALRVNPLREADVSCSLLIND